jgi:putative phosphoesterase
LPEFELLRAPLRIGLVSDTHLVNTNRSLPPALIEGLRDCDLILHGGDISRAWVLERLSHIAPVRAVEGNNDYDPELLLPLERYFQVGRHRIGLIHGHDPLDRPRMTARRFAQEQMRDIVDCVVYGHSHRPEVAERDGLLMVNPGSPTDPRWAPRPTYAIVEVGETLRARLIDL